MAFDMTQFNTPLSFICSRYYVFWSTGIGENQRSVAAEIEQLENSMVLLMIMALTGFTMQCAGVL